MTIKTESPWLRGNFSATGVGRAHINIKAVLPYFKQNLSAV